MEKREQIETTDPRKWHLKRADQSLDEATNQTMHQLRYEYEPIIMGMGQHWHWILNNWILPT